MSRTISSFVIGYEFKWNCFKCPATNLFKSDLLTSFSSCNIILCFWPFLPWAELLREGWKLFVIFCQLLLKGWVTKLVMLLIWLNHCKTTTVSNLEHCSLRVSAFLVAFTLNYFHEIFSYQLWPFLGRLNNQWEGILILCSGPASFCSYYSTFSHKPLSLLQPLWHWNFEYFQG